MSIESIGACFAEDMTLFAGDPRLGRRVVALVEAWQRKPGLGFPRIFDDAELEAAYRLFNNSGVNFDQLVAPHAVGTGGRCARFGEVLAIHDTTTFVFSGKRDGLGFINKDNRGFLGHFTLAVAAEPEAMPLGVLAATTWVRSELRSSKGVSHHKLRHSDDCESHRWLQGIKTSTALVGEQASVTHVMDREGDIYDCISAMVEGGMCFVVRASSNRCIESDDPDEHLLFDALEGLPVRYRDQVVVSAREAARMPDAKRSNPARDGRHANVVATATQVVLKRSRSCPQNLPAQTKVNLVHVFEADAPDDEKPVEWVLITTEPIDTDDDIRRVVDIYRKRWLIEEFFKAIKTGCSFQKRQLGSYHALLNALALCLPVAWGMLLARAQSRAQAPLPAESIIAPLRLQVLRAKFPKKFPSNPNLLDVAYAIARIGGHLKRNGPPGWLTLQRGFEELLILEEGWLLARETCDQS